ncbi:hypothetical protein FOQG_15090 [Fusarium oxysporum f. sp. raphani 54005]|uniref:Uncharacterized protein n=1 Tax=Fusarium oxysporum f. sp. raphani 54005 TaxID=1089458 RepID=X0BPI3_FUSOX|nr:hypothetical protein FOQG_15090 [Fusarium oxysporum f. sp. raphani 54005]
MRGIAQFDSVFQPTSSYRDFWPEVEGVAMILQHGQLNFNKSKRARDEIDVFKPNSEICNLGSMLFTFIRWRLDVFCGGVSFFSIYDESLSWICKVVGLSEEANVKFTVLTTLRKIIDRSKAFEVARLGGWTNGRMSTGKAGDYKDEKGSDKLGGHDFDITTMTEIERWRHEDKWHRTARVQ